MASRYKKFPNDKMYMKQWRKDNPGYYKYGPGYVNGKLKQRYCKECNVEVGKNKQRCPECMIIHRRAKAKAHYKYTPEMAAKSKKWREDNPDRCKELYQKARQRKLDKLGPKYCRRCKIEIERKINFCSPCHSIHTKEQKKIHNDKGAEKRKLKYDNRDKDAYNAYAREYQRGKKFRAYMREYQRSNRERINEYHRDRYQNDYEYRERMKHNWRKAYYRKKQNWYQLRVERIEKLKGYLEMNKCQ